MEKKSAGYARSGFEGINLIIGQTAHRELERAIGRKYIGYRKRPTDRPTIGSLNYAGWLAGGNY